MICKKCGKTIKTKSLKCGSCGEKHVLEECSGFDYKPSVHKPVKTETSGAFDVSTPKKNIGMIAAVAVAVAAVVCVALIAIFIPKGENDDKTSKPSSESKITTNDEPMSAMCFVDLDENIKSLEGEGEDKAREALRLVAGVYGYEDSKVGEIFYFSNQISTGEYDFYIFQQMKKDKPIEGRNMIVSFAKNEEGKNGVSGNYDPEEKPAKASPFVGEGDKATLRKIAENSGQSSEDWNAIDKDERIIIHPPTNTDTEFKATVVSSELYQMLSGQQKPGDIEIRAKQVWDQAKYMLTADATHEDVMDAVCFVAGDAYNYYNMKKGGNGSKIILLPVDGGKDRKGVDITSTKTDDLRAGIDYKVTRTEYDDITEFEGKEPDKEPEEDISKLQNLEKGKIYHFEINGETEEGKKSISFYVYWKDENSYLPYGTCLIKTTGESDSQTYSQPKENRQHKGETNTQIESQEGGTNSDML